MLTAKPSRQSSAVWQGLTKDGYTLRLTRSTLTQIISKLKQTGLEHLVHSLRSNNQVNLEGAVIRSIAQVVNHATASGTVSSREFGQNLRAFIAIGKTRKYQILTQPIDSKQSAIIFVRSQPKAISREWEGSNYDLLIELEADLGRYMEYDNEFEQALLEIEYEGGGKKRGSSTNSSTTTKRRRVSSPHPSPSQPQLSKKLQRLQSISRGKRTKSNPHGFKLSVSNTQTANVKQQPKQLNKYTEPPHPHGSRPRRNYYYREQTGKIPYKWNGKQETWQGTVKKIAGPLKHTQKPRQATIDPPGKQPGDHSGHLIAHVLGGPPDMKQNYTPMRGDFNTGQWKKIENSISDQLKKPKTQAWMSVQSFHKQGEQRPGMLIGSVKFNNHPELNFKVNNPPANTATPVGTSKKRKLHHSPT